MTPSEQPLIGIVGQLVEADRPYLKLANSYADAVLRAGGLPVAVPPTGGPADLERLCERLDGLLFSGGDDFDTERLGLGPTHACAEPVPGRKQDLDVALARHALAAELPVLGVCYGMQLLALVEGGRLFQHLPEDRPGSQEHGGGRRHAVIATPGTKLAAAWGLERAEVISRHHQAISEVGSDWIVSARDEEGLMEAIERQDHPFAVGVQWHPELSAPGGADDRLLRAFVEAANRARSARRMVAAGASGGF